VTTGMAATPAMERRTTHSAVAAQQRALAEVTRAPTRSSVASVGTQPDGPVDAAQQQEGGAEGATILDHSSKVAQEALPPILFEVA
jgi:hypothetical protein